MPSTASRSRKRQRFSPTPTHCSGIQHSQAERRYRRLGRSSEGRVLLVVYAVRRMKDGKETIRIISARQVSRNERKAYAG